MEGKDSVHAGRAARREAVTGHQCGQCVENEAILDKYKKLVDLLYKKIRQLQKKSEVLPPEQDASQHPRLLSQLSTNLTDSRQSNQNTAGCVETAKCGQGEEEKRGVSKREAQAGRRSSGCEGQLAKLQKVSMVINGLTEEVLQLKSNFMHIRHCVYAFVRELNLGQRIRGSPVTLSITLALIGIFEFSEEERQEMFNHRRVKLRRREKGKNKENVFVTVRELPPPG